MTTDRERAKDVLAGLEAKLERELAQARLEGSCDERDLMTCGHPSACLRPGSANASVPEPDEDHCMVCVSLDEIQALILKAREKAIRGDSGALHLMDEALTKLFRPIKVKGKPLSETIIEDRR